MEVFGRPRRDLDTRDNASSPSQHPIRPLQGKAGGYWIKNPEAEENLMEESSPFERIVLTDSIRLVTI